MKSIYYYIFLILFLGSSCREPFEPEISGFDHGLLVVEGFIEVGGGSSILHLSRSRPIYDSLSSLPLENALLVLEGEREGSWTFSSSGNGEYTLDDVLPENQNYILSIRTIQNQSYVSDPIRPVLTPDLESVTYEKIDGDVSIYANTYGNEEARYFKWDFEETWVYRTPYISFYTYNEELDSMELVPPSELTNRCWDSNINRRIILESSESYQNDYIYHKELVRIDSLSEKLGERYSILVKQQAISHDAFIFWEAIRKNSDDIGGIFSPLPSLLESNIKNTDDPNEPVIGYISAGKTIEKRIYINRSDVSPWRAFIQEYRWCEIDTVYPKDYPDFFSSPGGYVPLNEICEGIRCNGFYASTPGCTDCTLRGGVLERPVFWEE